MQKKPVFYIVFLLFMTLTAGVSTVHSAGNFSSGIKESFSALHTGLDSSSSKKEQQDLFCRTQAGIVQVSSPVFFIWSTHHFSALRFEIARDLEVGDLKMQWKYYFLHLFPSHFFW